MEMFELVLIMLILIGVSNVLNRFIPSVPVPLFQIALGTLVALLPPGLHMTLNTELFMLLFIAPLLYNDGKRTPREELWNLRSPILLLALGLVFVTVIAGGYFINWLIPSIPLPAAFALAAILSPTDAVAVGALAGRISLPKGILRLLEGESLMNDASGLVAFKFAVAATVTGVFSLTQVTFSFIWIALGGIVCGALISFLIVWIRIFLRRLGMEDVTIHMLLQLLTPFVIFIITEHLGFSGILGVVAGGIVHAIERDHTESNQAELRVVSTNTWSVILYILNGLVFVILGLQIPNATETIFQSPDYSNMQVIGFIGIISVGLILLRFIWVYLFWEGSWLLGSGEQMGKPKLTSSVLISLSGVRGAVTLAAAFSIPYVLQDGSPFPERDLIIFLAAGVILFSLIIASVVLPIISKSPEDESGKFDPEAKARIKIVQAGIDAVRAATNDENRTAAGYVVADYKKKLKKLQNGSSSEWSDTKRNRMEIKLRLVAIQAERQEIQNMLSSGDVSGELAIKVQEVIDQMEMVMSNRSKMKMAVALIRVRRLFSKQFTKLPEQRDMNELKQLREIKIRTSQAALEVIKSQMNDKNREAALAVIARYNESIERLQSGFGKIESEDVFNQHKNELEIKAIQAERNEVQALFESGEINWAVANKLRQYINYLEAGILEPSNEE
ncbi:CPA1 family monovalent cation:H+ antiporter [Paenibacillus anaericanus]|uniref:Na+/H+ antiporter n=1 Tax=Paenibacillus anaericanus TaxID=170367 RepID=A0A433Y209_9BACL|nr:Na+/H+ antiporter [Paenibacillus anaericanus]MDQ0089823.1 CPA1 family monovalent cation:H+ antiporter [Paenibacillus anaericanus]RUT41762.1 Na+/H+ antiporter [Paenibacillus anaericanus]